jgi:glycosyltransferase involved in cell wall biosynthesis
MRILMLGWELPPDNSGGLGVACYQLCKALAKKGADIEFVLPYTPKNHTIDFMRVNAAHPQNIQSIIKSGIAYDSYKYTMTNGETKTVDIYGQAMMYEEAVGKLVELASFDIIHAHDWLTCRAALRAKMMTGKPLIIHLHSIESDRAGKEHGGNPMVREIEALALMVADRIITVSEHTKRGVMREYGIPAEKIDVIHNHFDPANLEPQSGDSIYPYLERMKNLGYRVVANVGRLTIQKGLPNLLQAFAEVVKRAPKTFLLLVGDGEQKFELIDQAARLGIADKVFFTGFQRGKAYRDAYAVADLFVMPSISEPFGLVALESIGYGTPVLVSHQSGVSEVIHNCLKVDFWDINEMANKIVGVVQNDALRNELHHNSYREYTGHSWDDSADKLWNVYIRHTTAQERPYE